MSRVEKGISRVPFYPASRKRKYENDVLYFSPACCRKVDVENGGKTENLRRPQEKVESCRSVFPTALT